MESLMWASTRSWRGVSPVASGGPSGSSVTVFFGIASAFRSRQVSAYARIRPGACSKGSPQRTGISNTCSNRVSTSPPGGERPGLRNQGVSDRVERRRLQGDLVGLSRLEGELRVEGGDVLPGVCHL